MVAFHGPLGNRQVCLLFLVTVAHLTHGNEIAAYVSKILDQVNYRWFLFGNRCWGNVSAVLSCSAT